MLNDAEALEEYDDIRPKKAGVAVSMVKDGMCQGCGACVAHCPDGALEIKIFNDEQIYAEITGLFAAPGSRGSAPAETAASGAIPRAEAFTPAAATVPAMCVA